MSNEPGTNSLGRDISYDEHIAKMEGRRSAHGLTKRERGWLGALLIVMVALLFLLQAFRHVRLANEEVDREVLEMKR